MPNRILVTLYNSAGERVRVLYDGGIQFIDPDMELSAPLLITGQAPVTLSVGGAATTGQGTLSWDGGNDNGQAVSSGSYYFKIETTDSMGTVTALIRSVQVLNIQGQNSLEVFNSAGELVYRRVLGSAFDNAASMRLHEDTMVAGGHKDLEVLLRQGGNDTSLAWHGRNDAGALVNSGTYTMQWVHTSAGGVRQVQSKTFTVLRLPDSSLPGGDFKAAPNPVRGLGPVAIHFDPAPGLGLHARLYNAAGELVGQAQVDASAGRCTFGRSEALASGTYVAEIEMRQGAALLRRELKKVAIVR